MKILGYQELPLDKVFPHPNNPRPEFHTRDNDPNIAEMASSMQVPPGQLTPGLVYEIVGHYSHKDRPGEYFIVQGERRWRAAKTAELDIYKAIVIEAPLTPAHEQELLGSEEAYKLPWSTYFTMRHCWLLAQSLGVEVTSKELRSKTGLSLGDANLAHNIFQLEEPIQQLLAEYEEKKYLYRFSGKYKGRGRIGGVTKDDEFTIAKAATVYKIYEALRTNMPLTVRDRSALEIQTRLAKKAVRTNLDDLDDFRRLIENVQEASNIAVVGEVVRILSDNDYKVRTAVRKTGNAAARRFGKVSDQLNKMLKDVVLCAKQMDQCGLSYEELKDFKTQILTVEMRLRDLEQAADKRLQTLEYH